MAKLKIICFLFDPNTGGPTIRARSVYKRLISDGFEAQVAFPIGEGDAARFIADGGIPIERLAIRKPVLPRKLGQFLMFAVMFPVGVFRVYQYLRRERPDVIHVNGAFDLIPAFGGRLAGVPIVWHLNDTVFNDRLSRLLGWIVQRVATVIVVAANRVGQHYGVMNASPHVIFAPVDVSRFKARELSGFPRSSPQLTLIGNWNWIKGHDLFVDVISNLRKNGVDARGLAVGRFIEGQKTYWKPILDQMLQEGLDQFIECPGFSEDLPLLLGDTDLLLLTSHSEASPMSVLEAMSVGVPIVAFDVGGVREMLGVDEGDGIGAAGVVVPKGDVEAMSNSVQSLLSDPVRYDRMAKNGQSRARSNFSLECCLDRHLKAYGDAVGSSFEGALR